jgi:hypothetical protein
MRPTSPEGVIHVSRLAAVAAAFIAVAVLAIGATTAGAADKPSLADDVATRLGVSADTLRAAFHDALEARIDAAVEAGKLTPERAAKLKERLEHAKGLGLGIRKAFARRHLPFLPHIRAAARGLGAAAHYLGLTLPELRSELRDGKSLAQIASARGKSVDGLVDALLARPKARLERAVEHGRLTRERADKLLERLKDGVERFVQRTRGT